MVAAGLVGVDLAARYAAQDAMAAAVQRSTKAKSVSVTISSFPFIYDVLAEGRVDDIDVIAHDVPAGPVTLDTIELKGSQVRLDRSQLLDHRTVRLTSVGSATLSIVLSLSTIENALATDLGVSVTASGSNDLVVSAGGRTLATIDLTKVPIVPYCPVQLVHSGSTYTLSCTVSPVPQSVIEALSKAKPTS